MLNKTFKKIALVIGVIVLFGVLGLAGCAKQTEAIKIGATEVPHAEILEFAQPLLEEEGVEIEIVVVSDYVQPNLQLADKQLDANFFQHIPYLENMVEERGLDLTWVAKIHIEPLGIYSEKIDSLSQLEDGAQVGIPNDATNGGRALMLLEKAGLITLKEGTDVLATIYDIEDNPKNLQFHELEAAMLPRVLPDLDIAVINGNFALQAGLSPTKDALFLEGGDSPYANVIAVRTEDKDNEAIKKLVKVLTGPEVKQFIEETYEGGVIPAF